MKNLQKIAILVSLIGLGSIACSDASTKELSSETENPEMTSELSTQPYETENPEIASEMSELSSETENPEIASEMSELSSETENLEIASEMSELSSETENLEIASEMSELSSETENPEIASEMSTLELSSETENLEIPSDFSAVLENPILGQQVALQGKIIGEMEDCYIFSDGTNKILLHFEEPEVSYDPNQMVEISGVIEEGMIGETHNSEAAKHHNVATDTTVMVTQMTVIEEGEQS